MRISLHEEENPVSLARQCRKESGCPWPISTECPMSRMGIDCSDVKAEYWKKVIKAEIEYNEV